MELQDYIAPLRRWWWLLVVGTLCALVPTYFALGRQAPVYETHATLMIGRAISNPNPDYSQIYLTEQLANTYAEIAQQAPVQKAVMTALGLNWLPGYTVQLLANTQLVKVSVTDSDPGRAQAVANELGRQLVLQSPSGEDSEAQQRSGFLRAQLDNLETKIAETEAEITSAQASLASMLSAREIADGQAQIGALQNKLSTLQANYAALLANTQQGAVNSLTIVEPAELPGFPANPSQGRTLLLVAAIGLILSAGTAYLLSYLDDTLKTPVDVKRTLGLTTLAAVPVLDATGEGRELVMASAAHSAASEAYRVLRTNLQFAAVDRPLHTLLVTSPAPSEGKSLTTANLALALAQAGQRVVLVDADMHRPRQHKLFGLPNAAGLTSALLEEHPSLEGLLQSTGDPRLRLLACGPRPPNPTELLGSTRMRELLTALTDLADIVVFDSPPAVILADAAVLSTAVDGVLLVVQAGSTRRGMAEKGVETLRAVHARLLGVLMNRVPTRGAGYYYYYYYQGYGYGEQRKGSRRGILGRLGIGRKHRQKRSSAHADLPS